MNISSIIQEDLNKIVSADMPWSNFQGKTILVSGGGGLLASYIIMSLLVANERYLLNINIICVTRSNKSVELRLGAFLNKSSLNVFTHDISQPLPENFPPADFIIHSASQASPKYFGVDPVGTLMANTVGTMNLLNHAIKCKSEKFLFFSSGEVYGQPINPDKPIDEQDFGYLDPMKIRSCYAESKRIGETMCASWAHQYGLHTCVVRPFHTYGPGLALDDGRVFADFVADVVNKRDIVLKSDGASRRPFCYIADATIAFLTVLLKGEKAHAYNVANPYAEISMRDLANTIADLFPERSIGVRFDIPPVNNAYLKSPILRQCPSIEKITQLGWQPKINIADGFRRTILSYL